MREIYLRQPEFTYSACGPFKKKKERIKKKIKNRGYMMHLSQKARQSLQRRS